MLAFWVWQAYSINANIQCLYSRSILIPTIWSHISNMCCRHISIIILKKSWLIYDLPSEDWINTYYILKGFLKARRPHKVSNETKCTNEKMTWNTQDTNLSSYVPKTNVDHTISGQETGINILDHSAITQRAIFVIRCQNIFSQNMSFHPNHLFAVAACSLIYCIVHLALVVWSLCTMLIAHTSYYVKHTYTGFI